jgi:hypothetical protein
MNLTSEERAMLSGEFGSGVKRAMEIVVALGNVYGAKELVPVKSVQVSGVSYKNIGDAGLEFLKEWAEKGARVRVPTTLNPAGMDLKSWREMGIPEDFALKQMELLEAFREMGVALTCSCTPYLIGNVPGLGEHIAWSESSAVCFANSILGARTNREGGPSALAAAIIGRTVKYGLHLDENRKASYVVEVRSRVKSEADFGALGYIVGNLLKNEVPYLRLATEGLGERKNLIALGAAMAASGAVALYHIEGVTPEAKWGDVIAKDAKTIAIDGLEDGYKALNSPIESIEFVCIGCPHASLTEIEEVALWLEGRRVKAKLWVTTSRRTKEEAEELGLVEKIKASGGEVWADTCPIVAPIEEMGFRSMATNSAKMALYASSYCGLEVRFGTLEMCLDAAVKGRWY